MSDIRVTRSKTKCCLGSITHAGRQYLLKNYGEDPIIRGIDYLEDLIEEIKFADLTIDD